MEQRWKRWSFAVVGAAVLAPGAWAHHSLSRDYDGNRQVTITGTVAEFRLVQPHSFLVLEIDAEATDTELWRLEMDNYWELVEIGLTPDTFKPGDRVVATGAPSRSDEPQLYLRRLDRPADGLRYEQIGYRPSLGTMGEGTSQ